MQTTENAVAFALPPLNHFSSFSSTAGGANLKDYYKEPKYVSKCVSSIMIIGCLFGYILLAMQNSLGAFLGPFGFITGGIM